VRRRFAVIVPAYNEADNVPQLIAELRATWEKHGLGGEVVLVDDGSTDGTATRAREVGAGWDRLKVVRHRSNFGKTEAMLTGMEATDADWLVLFDADLQHDTEEIPRYLEKLAEGWDIVTGRKIGPYEKAVVSGTYNRISRALFKVPVSDLNSMKGFRREVLDQVPLRHDWHRFFVVIAYGRGFTVTEIDIKLYPRRHGKAKYSARSRIVVGALDLLAVAFFLFFSRKPMIFFGLSGFVTFSSVIFPQALRLALPGTGTMFVDLLKSTSLLVVISAGELMSQAQLIASQTFRALEVYIVIAAIYFAVCYPLSQLLLMLERRVKAGAPLSPGRARRLAKARALLAQRAEHGELEVIR
jgi:glycosyltransferase involved in cell wall biosynthesis